VGGGNHCTVLNLKVLCWKNSESTIVRVQMSA
jgi:hypothetical protein